MRGKHWDSGDKRDGIDCTLAKLKYDWQIIAIAKVHKADAIYSDDKHLHAHGEKAKIKVLRLVDLPLPKKEIENAELVFPNEEEMHNGEKSEGE